jgi:hypothetical protein
LRYLYLGLADPNLDKKMTRILRSNNLDVISIGDPAQGLNDPESTNLKLRSFLEQLLPWPSRFERPIRKTTI